MGFAARRMIVVFAVVLAAWGCRGETQKKVIGMWVIDTDATLASLKNDPMWSKMPEEARRQMTPEMLAEKLGGMSITFTEATVAMPGAPKQLPYTVKSSEGNTLVINITGETNNADLMMEFEGKDTMKFKSGGPGPRSLAMMVGVWKRKQ